MTPNRDKRHDIPQTEDWTSERIFWSGNHPDGYYSYHRLCSACGFGVLGALLLSHYYHSHGGRPYLYPLSIECLLQPHHLLSARFLRLRYKKLILTTATWAGNGARIRVFYQRRALQLSCLSVRQWSRTAMNGLASLYQMRKPLSMI